ncbi:MAG: EVE domain-containing protein [Myxococcota bacterium]|nr:EVE domain-containing protein [Myxococcota bacterium]
MNYWLVKTEPEVFSIDDLLHCPNKTTCWDGVRNYQARNFMRDQIKLHDGILVYHSSTNPMRIVGQAKVTRESYPDPSQFEASSAYFDPKATIDSPRWIAIEIQFVRKFPHPIDRDQLRNTPKLREMALLKKGNRLSVMPISMQEWDIITMMGG